MAKRQSKSSVYYIVNPSGAIHICTREHAAWRLAQGLGWRMPTKDEIDKYKSNNGKQVWDKPIATPFSTEPVAIEEIEESNEN